MAVDSFSAFMNWFIPFLLIAIIIIFIWYKFREPLSMFFGWVAGLFQNGSGKTQNTVMSRVTGDLVYQT